MLSTRLRAYTIIDGDIRHVVLGTTPFIQHYIEKFLKQIYDANEDEIRQNLIITSDNPVGEDFESQAGTYTCKTWTGLYSLVEVIA